MINQELGCIGETVDYQLTNVSALSLTDLEKSATAGEIQSLIILGGNPVLSSSTTNWDELFNKIENKIHLGPSVNETSLLCDIHIAQSHYLESWDEGKTWDGAAISGSAFTRTAFRNTF